MKNLIKILIFALTLMSTTFAKESSKPYIDDFTLGVGNLSEFIGHIQTGTSDETNGLDFNPYFNTIIEKQILWPSVSFLGEFGMTLPHSGQDSNTTRWTFNLIPKLAYTYSDIKAHIGLGFSWTRIYVGGGTQRLQNGPSGSFTDFPMPDGSRFSQNMIVALGLNYRFYDKYSATTDFHLFNLTNELRRTWSFIIGVNYHFDKVEFDI